MERVIFRVLPMYVLGVVGCADGKGPDTEAGACAQWIVATDIDETLTTGDAEWVTQMIDPTHDPAMRPDADTLMNAYADRGYRVVYVTARGEDMALADGRMARDATWDWLTAHGFPGEPDDLYLATGIGVMGDDAVAYKSEVLQDLAATGWPAAWAYGNAESDIDAFLAVGLDPERVFLVGELAGTMGVEAIPDEDAYTGHLEGQLDGVDDLGCP